MLITTTIRTTPIYIIDDRRWEKETKSINIIYWLPEISHQAINENLADKKKKQGKTYVYIYISVVFVFIDSH